MTMTKREVSNALEELAEHAIEAAQAVRREDWGEARSTLSQPTWPEVLTDAISELEEEAEGEDDDDA